MTLRLLPLALRFALPFGVVAAAALPAAGCMQAQQMMDQAVRASQTVDATWDANAMQFRGRNGARIAYACSPGGDAGPVWGTSTYSDDSSVCTAGVHAGRISFAQGGRVVIEIRSGAGSYQASMRNGVETRSYGSWPGSFVVL